jgi:hypothetical protein
MHFTRTAVAAAAIVTGALALTACSSNSGSASASSSTTSAPVASTLAASSGGTDTNQAGNGSPAAGSTGTAGNSSPTSENTSVAGNGSSNGRCHTGDLSYSWGTPSPNGNPNDQQHAYVVLKNTGAHTCSMHGFPGVDLVNSGTQWPLRRNAQSPATVTLQPGHSTRFTVTFLPWTATGNVASNNFAPTALVITPPNETTSYDLPWRWGHVLLQDAATHPGTYVGPIGG